MVYQYNIKISHFNYSYLIKLITQLIFLINNLFNPSSVKLVSLPNKKNTTTVLRSPHVYKKSREQFSKTIYNKLIVITCSKNSSKILSRLLSNINCYYKLTITYEKS